MSHIYTKEIQIHGASVNTEVFVDAGGSEWIRFMTEGCWGPQTVSDTDACIQVCVNDDGSISAVMQKLIPIEKASNDDWLNEVQDRMLNNIEQALGLNPDSLSSSMNWAGHSSDQLDDLMVSFDKAIIAGETVRAIMPISTLANICGYFFNHCHGHKSYDYFCVNSGFNCRHPEQEEIEDGIGCCYAWSCPLCNTSNGLICAKCGVECEDCGTEDCKCEDDYVIATIPKVFFREVEMYPVPEN